MEASGPICHYLDIWCILRDRHGRANRLAIHNGSSYMEDQRVPVLVSGLQSAFRTFAGHRYRIDNNDDVALSERISALFRSDY